MAGPRTGEGRMSLEENMRVAPSQPRSKARVESILAAARRHYEEVGRDRFTFEGVAAVVEPKCSVGTIYRYFSDRVALLDALFPDRDRAEIKIAAIRNLRTMDGSAAEKWLSVEHILDQP